MSAARHSVQPSTEGASISGIRVQLGSVHRSRKRRLAAISTSTGSSIPHDGLGDGGHHVLLDLLVHGAEEVALVGEVVVERAAGDPRLAHDLLGPDVHVALRR